MLESLVSLNECVCSSGTFQKDLLSFIFIGDMEKCNLSVLDYIVLFKLAQLPFSLRVG